MINKNVRRQLNNELIELIKKRILNSSEQFNITLQKEDLQALRSLKSNVRLNYLQYLAAHFDKKIEINIVDL